MDPKRWHRAQQIFQDVVDQTPEARAALLAEACGEDAELRDAVDRMLAADADAPSVLDLDGDDLAEIVDGGVDGPPKRLGPYEIRELIGRGGMGTVYRAGRVDGRFERDVALKLIRTGYDATESLRRFRSEGRILARLEHSNIARLYDAGVEDGQPYLVMEFIRGERIDRYCDAHRSSIDQRLRLFEEVCEAVQFAHQNLVIHRDLKPSNILITADGLVKLLDFGISKLIEDEPGSEVDQTRTGMRAMTVEYSSPEQIRGEPVTTASDVYSLGVVLFELLTGHRPYDDGTGPLDTARAVVEDEAWRPSAAVSRSDGLTTTGSAGRDTGPAEVASRRASTTDQLARKLRGDLDTILLKALQKDPTRRYASVQTLLDDIRRHLAGLPVLARPDTVSYRMRKFVRRNWVGVAASAAVALALITGLGLAIWQARVAETQRDAARLEADKANRVTDFLISVFEVADPDESRADTLTAAQILDRGAARIETELSAEPAIQATMMDVIGRVYTRLSLFDQADSLLRGSLDRRLALFGPEHPDVAQSVQHLASLAFLRGDPSADSIAREAVDLARRTYEPDDPRLATTNLQLAFAVLGRDNATAEAALGEAERVARLDSVAHERILADVLYARGFIRHDEGAYEEAERLYREALAIQRELLGSTHSATLITMSNLGSLLELLGRYEAADSALQAVLAARREVYGDRHARVSNSLVALAELRYAQAEYAEAEEYSRAALAMREAVFGENHPQTISAAFYVARVLAARGDIDGAEALYREILAEAEARGEANTGFARLVNGFAGILEARGDLAGAEAFYRRAVDVYVETVGETHPFTAIVRGNVAATLLDQGRLDEAEPLFESSLVTLRNAWGDSHETVGVVRLQLATLRMERGELRQAETGMREALGILEGALPPDHWRVGQAKLRLGACLADLDRLDEAESLLVSSFEILEPWKRARFGDWRQLLSELFDLYTELNQPDEAARYRDLFRASAPPAG